ncbi:unnamed protein product, partial [Hapterophycus canaliculatus]
MVPGEELLLNTVSLVTNLSFYGPGANEPAAPLPDRDHGAGFKRHEVLCGHLVKVLLHPNAEAVAEAARAFGNFSRDPSCRAAIAERRGDEVLVALLGHPCREVVFAAAGAIVNLAGDRAGRARLSGEEVGAGERLARLVRRAGLADPGMAGLACQALHNLLMVEEPPPGGGHGGALRDVLGGPEAYNKLWWTLQELTEACSWEGRSVGGQPGQSRDELGGFLAAAKAV